MCGEHIDLLGGPWGAAGSSPHVRGTQLILDGLQHPLGIIPACAGNTGLRGSEKIIKGDHPRMCGEHKFFQGHSPGQRGSSPHVRGTHRVEPQARPQLGIIPACAGNTLSRSRSRRGSGDHPRMCGEHISALSVAVLAAGSSPHVRGTRTLHAIAHEHAGIIPACAGNTTACATIPARTGDHPRMCGEHMLTEPPTVPSSGSSPHVRGTHLHQGRQVHYRGIIPACAGNTWQSRLSARPNRDHPRMCGEHNERGINGLADTGSSPHVRGTLAGLVLGRLSHGIIPACAGNTRSR